MALLDKLKTYFNIYDDSKNAILELIIDNVIELQKTLNFSESLIFLCCVEDFSRYLKSGNSQFTTSQSAELSLYSPELVDMIKRTIPIQVF